MIETQTFNQMMGRGIFAVAVGSAVVLGALSYKDHSDAEALEKASNEHTIHAEYERSLAGTMPADSYDAMLQSMVDNTDGYAQKVKHDTEAEMDKHIATSMYWDAYEEQQTSDTEERLAVSLGSGLGLYGLILIIGSRRRPENVA